MRRVKVIRDKVLSRAGRYQEVRPEGVSSNDPASLKVKEVMVDDTRYIVCLNPAQARKEASDRENIVHRQLWQDISSRWCSNATDDK